MTLPRVIISIAVCASLALALYLLILPPRLTEVTNPPTQPEISAQAPAPPSDIQTRPERPAIPRRNARLTETPRGGSGTHPVEIFGTVSDAEGRPIEGVLVTEERYYTSTSSDALGNYRLRLELPYHRWPTLNFLRAGYLGERIRLTRQQLKQRPQYELDMALAGSADTLRLSGWVANDNGIGLEGVRVEISAVASAEADNFYLTVFSDERGNFVLEGARANTHYKLTASRAPQYPIYRDDHFHLGSESEALEIVLKSLQFVDLGGMMLTPAGAPVANFEIEIKNLSTGVHNRRIVSDSSGFFSLAQFPLGAVSLSTRGAEFYQIDGMVLDATNYSNLVVQVDRGDAYLSGWVNDSSGYPVEKAMITASTARSANGVDYSTYRSQATDANGRFSFENMVRGEHRIAVYANGYEKLKTVYAISNQGSQLNLTLARPVAE